MTYPNLNNEPELLKLKTRDNEIRNLKYQTEKHDHENILKSLITDNDNYKKNYESLKKKKILLFITEILMGSGSAIGSSTMGLTNSGAGIIISSSTALLTIIAILITNEYITNLKVISTKLRKLINVITLLYENTLKQSLIDKKFNEKKAEKLKKIYNQYIDKRKEIMKNNSFKVEDAYGNVMSKDKFSQEQTTKLNNFPAKIM